jgi:hypothetical protein
VEVQTAGSTNYIIRRTTLFIVRRHAPIFILGIGHELFQGMPPVWLFRDDAHGAMASYNNAKFLLAAMVERKNPVGAK